MSIYDFKIIVRIAIASNKYLIDERYVFSVKNAVNCQIIDVKGNDCYKKVGVGFRKSIRLNNIPQLHI